MRIGLKHRGKEVRINAKECKGICKFIGLMFKKKETASALLFDFKKPTNTAIHSYFVFFSFVAIWIDEDGNIIDKKIIKPFTLLIRPKKFFARLIEIPINKEYGKTIKLLVGN